MEGDLEEKWHAKKQREINRRRKDGSFAFFPSVT